MQVSAAAGLGPDGGLYGGSLLPGEVQDEASVSTHTGITLISHQYLQSVLLLAMLTTVSLPQTPTPALSTGGTGTQAHLSSSGGLWHQPK